MSVIRAASLALCIAASACGGGARPANDPGPPPPTPAPAAPDAAPDRTSAVAEPDGPCTADTDCVAFQQEDGCCDMCGWRALTKSGFAAFRVRCATRKLRCPAFDCPYQARHAVCVQGRCGTAPDDPPRPPEGACRPATADERAAILEAERHMSATGQLRGSPPPPSPPPMPPPAKKGAGRVIALENLDVSRESLEPHAWGVIHERGDGNPNMLVVFRFDRAWLAHVYPEDRLDAELARAGHAVEVGPGPHVRREPHQDLLLAGVERVCPSP